MKPQEKTEAGRINIKGVLECKWERFINFFQSHKDTDVLITVQVLPQESSRALQGFYFGKILPDFVNAYREYMGEIYSITQMDKKLRAECPLMTVERYNGEGFEAKTYTLKNAGTARAMQYIDWIYWQGAERFNLTFDY